MKEHREYVKGINLWKEIELPDQVLQKISYQLPPVTQPMTPPKIKNRGYGNYKYASRSNNQEGSMTR